ncbi:bifunctional glycosyltransferase/CDP-glycerol:glycerophosphate glycerophosphotransferase [Streptomyces sp. enrichment culture]|uniref:bifunctional glycosyltransferase/CDP-glycerol:glycerophosphate glycerophosphotransferase n=1 Tax=Streptomyces sp. enrichment culture TaxID=1795815 RepID=UPI003F549F26
MPRFSVIVPAYRVQAYLSECLDSVLSQSYPDLELIAVDDASPDACGALIDAFAARDPRVRAVHLAQNTGPGPARNAGIERATGDYLLFLDGDDTLAPEALLALADRLKETDEPDVLVYGHARTHWSGQAPGARAAAGPLTECGPAPFRTADRPALLNLPPVAWDKAYRREFVEREGFAFPPGLHQDAPWTYPVLMTARTVATLDRVCVRHRQRRVGGLMRTAGARHFDVFDQYDRVFAFLDERPELARWRPVLFRRMVDHLTAVYAHRDRLPRGARGAFLRRARSHYRRHRTPGASVPAGARVHHALIRLGLRRTYAALRLASALRRGAVRRGGRLLRALRGAGLRLHYRTQRLLPLRDDLAVFSSGDGHGHGGDPGALESAFRSLAPHIRTAWVSRPEHLHTVPPGARRLGPGTAAYWTALARAAHLVSDTAFDPRLVKRKRQVLVQTQQGTPFARTGLDLAERPAAASEAALAALLRDAGRWDYLVSADLHSTLTFERTLPGGYTVLEYGRPRADRLHTATAADVARLRDALGVPDGAVAILHAPADRDYRRSRAPLLDLERLARRLGPRFVILDRSPAGHDAPPLAATGRVLDVSGHPHLETLCLASDVLVTDYAPLMADYAGLDRPIVLHVPDREAFEAVRGTVADPCAFPPGAVARSADELADIFATGHWRGSRSDELRAAFRARFCPHDDGHAAERVVRRVLFGEDGLPVVVPPGERRPVPSAAAARAGAPLTTASAPVPGADVPGPRPALLVAAADH